jgi:putative ABC transport system permease protein
VVVVNEAFARRYFPGEDAIGKRFQPEFGSESEPKMMREIVGIVGDIKQHGLGAPALPTYYTPYTQGLISSLVFCVKTTVQPESLLPAVQREVSAMDPEVPLFDPWTMDYRVSRSVAQPRFNAYLLGTFAVLALLLSAIGLYGVMAYSVAQRTREIGLRIALGATQPMVLRMVLKNALILAGLGMAIGLAFAVVLTQSIASFTSLLFGVRPLDAITLLTVVGVFTAVAVLAGYLPARRAMKVDPIIALRYE